MKIQAGLPTFHTDTANSSKKRSYAAVQQRVISFVQELYKGDSMTFYARYFLILLLLLPCKAFAEIEKIAIPNDKGISFYWWPKITPPQGWVQDKAYSYHYAVNAMTPEGYTFANAKTVMYAKANYKPRDPDIKSLEAFMERDKEIFLSKMPNIRIIKTDSLHTADRKIFISYNFFPEKAGNWEKVAYGEEGDFYIVFTISARSKEEFDSSESAFKALVENYTESPENFYKNLIERKHKE